MSRTPLMKPLSLKFDGHDVINYMLYKIVLKAQRNPHYTRQYKKRVGSLPVGQVYT